MLHTHTFFLLIHYMLQNLVLYSNIRGCEIDLCFCFKASPCLLKFKDIFVLFCFYLNHIQHFLSSVGFWFVCKNDFELIYSWVRSLVVDNGSHLKLCLLLLALQRLSLILWTLYSTAPTSSSEMARKLPEKVRSQPGNC